jgi:hypothetical protein
MGNLGSLAGLAGLNLDNPAGDAIRPDLYPEVLQSVPFALQTSEATGLFQKLQNRSCRCKAI